MKKALVCGAGGFIGAHMVKKLKKEKFWVRGVDLKKPPYCESHADEFLIGDLSKSEFCNSSKMSSGESLRDFLAIFKLLRTSFLLP